MQRPSIGRMVHYLSRGSADGVYGAQCRAAVITQVTSGVEVGLCVMNPTGLFFHENVEVGGDVCPDDDSQPHEVGTWHWPTHV